MLPKPVLPTLPKRTKAQGNWSAQTRKAWMQWRKDPATSQYGPSECQIALDTAYLYEEFARGSFKMAPEIRLRLDGLGLTAKGKRDLRWRLPAAAPVIPLADRKQSSAAERMQKLRDRGATTAPAKSA